ncbi:unnamed protein product, partial [Allacma fusca]
MVIPVVRTNKQTRSIHSIASSRELSPEFTLKL